MPTWRRVILAINWVHYWFEIKAMFLKNILRDKKLEKIDL